MAFDVLIVTGAICAVWWWYRTPHQARHARGQGDVVALLAYEDLPPVGAFAPPPEEEDLPEYVEDGLEQLRSYLSGRDQTA